MVAVLINEARRQLSRGGDFDEVELDFLVPFRKPTDASKKAMRKALTNLKSLEGLPQ